VFDPSSPEDEKAKDSVRKNTVAECILKLDLDIAFDAIGELQETARFVLVDGFDIAGGGIILEGLEDKDAWIKEKVFLRNYMWIKSGISKSVRNERYAQTSAVVFLTGKKDSGRKQIARRLEFELFEEGKSVYYLGIGNVIYGVDADIKGLNDTREEHLRRFSEVGHIMFDAGIFLIVQLLSLHMMTFTLCGQRLVRKI